MVTYNRLGFTRRSISSIAETAGYPYELTVVDNGSRDGTVAYLQEQTDAGKVHRLILNSGNRGVAFAANQGWAAGGRAHYVKVDNDIVFQKPGWLERMVEACDRLLTSVRSRTTSRPSATRRGLSTASGATQGRQRRGCLRHDPGARPPAGRLLV